MIDILEWVLLVSTGAPARIRKRALEEYVKLHQNKCIQLDIEDYKEVIGWIKKGKRILAIKALRKATELGLKECDEIIKDYAKTKRS